MHLPSLIFREDRVGTVFESDDFSLGIINLLAFIHFRSASTVCQALSSRGPNQRLGLYSASLPSYLHNQYTCDT